MYSNEHKKWGTGDYYKLIAQCVIDLWHRRFSFMNVKTEIILVIAILSLSYKRYRRLQKKV